LQVPRLGARKSDYRRSGSGRSSGGRNCRADNPAGNRSSINATALNGLDALLSTVQMPGGIPVATMAIGSAGAKNAAPICRAHSAIEDKGLSTRLSSYIKKMAKDVEKKQKNLEILMPKS